MGKTYISKEGKVWEDTGRDFTGATLAMVAGVSPTFIHQQVKEGKIQAQKLGPKLYYIKRYEGERWIRERELKQYFRNEEKIKAKRGRLKAKQAKRWENIRTVSRLNALDKREEQLKAELKKIKETRKALKDKM